MNEFAKLAGVLPNSLVNGKGTRFVIFFSGCTHNCSGCHNKEMQNINSGENTSLIELYQMIDKARPIINGITLSGGDPFMQADKATLIAQYAHSKGLNVWTYTGYTYQELLKINKPSFNDLLDNTDTLVDGRFVETLKDASLKYRGSSNQSILALNDLRKLVG